MTFEAVAVHDATRETAATFEITRPSILIMSRRLPRSASTLWTGVLVSHYNLFKREAGWSVERVLVVSPFVEGSFFEELIGRLRPKQVYVVLDDGCRSRDVEVVKAAVSSGKRRPQSFLAQASASGLVHAKVFFVEELSKKGVRRCSLICGSANATRQGFTPELNAELLLKTRLKSGAHREIVDWMNAVMNATAAAAQTKCKTDVPSLDDAELQPNLHIHLPRLRIGSLGLKDSGLDAWLQQGRLLSEYKVDPSFLHVQIQLKKPLPQGTLAEQASLLGLRSGQTKALSFSYLGVQWDWADGEGSTPVRRERWRSKYFVWTNLGEWCSRSCYEAKLNDFRKGGHEGRAAALGALKSLSAPEAKANAVSSMRSVLLNLWSAAGEDASEYLRSANGKEPDYKHYEERLSERIDRDIELSADPEFVARFINGFELTEMPRFRSDPTGWTDFTLSFGRQIIYDGLKGRAGRLPRDSIADALAEAGVSDLETSEQVIEALRQHWTTKVDDDEVDTVGEWVADYHLWG